MFRKILLATTPADKSSGASDLSFALARPSRTQLFIFHAYGLPEEGWSAIRYLLPSGKVEEVKKELENYFAPQLSKIENYEVQVVPGIPKDEILRFARKKNVDLIVMGPHRVEENPPRIWGMIGSTLQKVSLKAKCPVMIVPPDVPQILHQEGEMHRGSLKMAFQNIVLAMDFSEPALCAFNYAFDIAKFYKATLHIFYAMPLLENDEYPSAREIESKIQMALEKMTIQFGTKLSGQVDYTIDAWEGAPHVEILKLARICHADLIVMAHHSEEKDPEKAVLGSTVIKVAGGSSCPVLSINRDFVPKS